MQMKKKENLFLDWVRDYGGWCALLVVVSICGQCSKGCSVLNAPKDQMVDIIPGSDVWNAELDYKTKSPYIDAAGNSVFPECHYDMDAKKCFMSRADYEQWCAARVRGLAAVQQYQQVK